MYYKAKFTDFVKLNYYANQVIFCIFTLSIIYLLINIKLISQSDHGAHQYSLIKIFNLLNNRILMYNFLRKLLI